MHAPTVYVALSDHGYGHATRAASIVAHVLRLEPAIRVVFAGHAPRWLLEIYVGGAVELRPVALDAGVVQSDSVTIDMVATIERLARLESDARGMVARESDFARRSGVRLVLADIPSLAVDVAAGAHAPCWMVGNFGWDFIYGAWSGKFAPHAEAIAERYARCDRLFRVPFHEPMVAFPHVTDVGLTGGEPRRDPAELAERFGVRHPRERTALLTSGGLGLSGLPYVHVAARDDWCFITGDDGAPELDNLVRVNDRSVRPVDLMPLCGRVIGKPGYSTFSEATRLGVPVVTFPRHGFAEAEILIDGVRDHARHQVLTEDEFFGGRWDFLDEEPAEPLSGTALALDGSEAVAAEIVRSLATGATS